MPKINRVKAAQQRYETVPVLDENGQPKRTPVLHQKGPLKGQQRTDKRGNPVFMAVTVADKTQPLPNHTCGKCGVEIKVGDPYKSISIRSTYSSRTLYRCAACPDWHVWEYSSSLSARLAEISYNFWEAIAEASSEEEAQDALNAAAEAVREIAGEKEEGAQNIEDGFQHETYQSAEMRDQAESLNSWADEIEGASIPDFPETEEVDCEECDGSGVIPNPEHETLADRLTDDLGPRQRKLEEALKAQRELPATQETFTEITRLSRELEAVKAEVATAEEALSEMEADIACDTCDGSGRFEPDEPTTEQIESWREELQSDLSIVDESPV